MGGLQAGYESSGAWSTDMDRKDSKDKDEVSVDILCQVPDMPTPASRSGRSGDSMLYHARIDPQIQLQAHPRSQAVDLKQPQMIDQSSQLAQARSMEIRPSVLGIAAVKAKQRETRLRRVTRNLTRKPPVWTKLSAPNPLTAQWYAYIYALTRARLRTRPDEYPSHLPGQHSNRHLRQSTTHIITGVTTYEELLPYLRSVRLDERWVTRSKSGKVAIAATATTAICIGQINIQMILESIAYQRHRRDLVCASNRAAQEAIAERLKSFESVIIGPWWVLQGSEQEEEDVEDECSLNPDGHTDTNLHGNTNISASVGGRLLPELDGDVDDLAVENMFTARPIVQMDGSTSPEMSDLALSSASATAAAEKKAEEEQEDEEDDEGEIELLSRKRRARSESTEERAEQAAFDRRERASELRTEEIGACIPSAQVSAPSSASQSLSISAQAQSRGRSGSSSIDEEFQRVRAIRAAAAAAVSRLYSADSGSTSIISPVSPVSTVSRAHAAPAAPTAPRVELIIPTTRRLTPIPILPFLTSPPSSSIEANSDAESNDGRLGASRGGRRLGSGTRDISMPTPSPSASPSLSPQRANSAQLHHTTHQRRSSVSALSEVSEVSELSRSSDDSTSTVHSGPPNYDDIEPPIPISLPIARPPPQATSSALSQQAPQAPQAQAPQAQAPPSSQRMNRRLAPAHPPAYQHFLPLRGAAYSHTRTPSPPPPFNAQTDCQTLIAPVFVEDDEDEERVMRRILPSGQLRLSPSPPILSEQSFSATAHGYDYTHLSHSAHSRAMERVVSDPIVVGAFPRYPNNTTNYHNIDTRRPSGPSAIAQAQQLRAHAALLAHSSSNAHSVGESFDAARYMEQAAYDDDSRDADEDDDEVAAELEEVDDEGWDDDADGEPQGTLGRLWRWAGSWI